MYSFIIWYSFTHLWIWVFFCNFCNKFPLKSQKNGHCTTSKALIYANFKADMENESFSFNSRFSFLPFQKFFSKNPPYSFISRYSFSTFGKISHILVYSNVLVYEFWEISSVLVYLRYSFIKDLRVWTSRFWNWKK